MKTLHEVLLAWDYGPCCRAPGGSQDLLESAATISTRIRIAPRVSNNYDLPRLRTTTLGRKLIRRELKDRYGWEDPEIVLLDRRQFQTR
jgi:hypothetical protein